MRRSYWALLGLWLGIVSMTAGAALVGCRATGGAAGSAGRGRPLPLAEPVRAIWVARTHYHSPDDVRTIIRNCAALGCNTVLWQVRGEATVAYPSKIEPWSREYGHRDPGFDPLALAVEQAHRHGLRIEAWVNVLPGWGGKKPPSMRSHLWNAHPDWFLQDAHGKRQPLGGFYVIVNPCLPKVRKHIVRVIEEIVTRYNVDGVHLDYVRYAWDTTPNAAQKYPRDRRTLALYQRQTRGKHPDDDPVAWRNWRANQLTRLVDEIRTMLNRRRPGATLTAAVVSHPRTAYEQYFQNAVAWLRCGLVDALLPMAYTEKLSALERDIDAYRRLVGHRRIVPGLGIYKHKTAQAMRDQLARCVEWGGDFALFSYAALFSTQPQGPSGKPAAARRAQQDLRRAVLSEFRGP